MNKTKLLFMLINMNVGGTEKALLNMLEELPKEKYEITVLLLEKKGEFLRYLPKDVHIQEFKEYERLKENLNNSVKRNFNHFLKNKRPIKAVSIVAVQILSKLKGERSFFYKYLLKECKGLENEYDVAIAYAGPMELITYFIANKVRAKRKVQWIHFDITRVYFNKKFAEKMYRCFHNIFVVSEKAKEIVINSLPSYKKNIESFKNIVSKKQIKNSALEGEGFYDNYSGIRILTVGRLSREKGQDLTIPVLSRLKKEGYQVKWYCIGDGEDRELYEKMINKYQIEEDYILLGSKINPYPFMMQCDLYVQPSRYEGFCITLSEARCFNNPIVTTNFTGALEQITNGQTGLIINFNEESLYRAIKKLLDNSVLYEKIKLNLVMENPDTAFEIKKFENIVQLTN